MIISNSSSLSLQPSERKSFKYNWKKKFNKVNPNPSSLDDYLEGPSSRRRGTIVRVSSEIAQDAPFVAAIGASVLTSFLIPVQEEEEEKEKDGGGGGGGGVIDSTDARLAVMGIIAFIPYFNWMSWVFAWLDTGKQRYLAYAVVYFAPYLSSEGFSLSSFCHSSPGPRQHRCDSLENLPLIRQMKRRMYQKNQLELHLVQNHNYIEYKRTNFSISPYESWLPIASILLCILHIQLEASLRNGDLKAPSLFSTLIGKGEDVQFQNREGLPKKGRSKEQVELPSAHNKRDDFRDWGIPRNPSKEIRDANTEESKLD